MAISRQRWHGRLDQLVAVLIHLGAGKYGDSYAEFLENGSRLDVFDDRDREALRKIFDNGIPVEGMPEDKDEELLGIKDYAYVRNHHAADLVVKLAEDKDYASLYDSEQKRLRKKEASEKRKKIYVVMSILAAIAIGVVVYNLPYFAEKRAYKNVVERTTYENTASYLEKYDNAEHTPHVLYLGGMCYLQDSKGTGYKTVPNEGIYYDPHQLSTAKLTVEENFKRLGMQSFESLIRTYPDSKWAKKALSKMDSVWEDEIFLFKEKHPDFDSSPAVKRMLSLLEYMREKNVLDIKLEIVPHVDVHDADYYESEIVKAGVKSVYNVAEDISSYFDDKRIKQADKLIVRGAQRILNEVYSPDFIHVVVDSTNNMPDLPVWRIEYSIKNQMINANGLRIPELWTLQEETPPYGCVFLLGIETDFTSRMTYDGCKVPWELSREISPDKSVRARSNGGAYFQMMCECVEEFFDTLYSAL